MRASSGTTLMPRGGNPSALYDRPMHDGRAQYEFVDGHLVFSMIKDAARFVPELAPLAATALALHRAEKGRRPEPDVIGFGEPDERP